MVNTHDYKKKYPSLLKIKVLLIIETNKHLIIENKLYHWLLEIILSLELNVCLIIGGKGTTYSWKKGTKDY